MYWLDYNNDENDNKTSQINNNFEKTAKTSISASITNFPVPTPSDRKKDSSSQLPLNDNQTSVPCFDNANKEKTEQKQQQKKQKQEEHPNNTPSQTSKTRHDRITAVNKTKNTKSSHHGTTSCVTTECGSGSTQCEVNEPVSLTYKKPKFTNSPKNNKYHHTQPNGRKKEEEEKKEENLQKLTSSHSTSISHLRCLDDMLEKSNTHETFQKYNNSNINYNNSSYIKLDSTSSSNSTVKYIDSRFHEGKISVQPSLSDPFPEITHDEEEREETDHLKSFPISSSSQTTSDPSDETDQNITLQNTILEARPLLNFLRSFKCKSKDNQSDDNQDSSKSSSPVQKFNSSNKTATSSLWLLRHRKGHKKEKKVNLQRHI